jgi:hypothetical protein
MNEHKIIKKYFLLKLDHDEENPSRQQSWWISPTHYIE